MRHTPTASLSFRLVNIGGRWRYSLIPSKVVWHSDDHTFLVVLFELWDSYRNLKNDWHLSVHQDMDMLRFANLPVNFWIYFEVKEGISSIARIWSGFTSIPFLIIIYAKNLPSFNPNEHFIRFNLMFNLVNPSKILWRCYKCVAWGEDLTTISSMYTSTTILIRYLNIVVTNFW